MPTRQKKNPPPELIAAALGFPASTKRLNRSDSLMAELFQARHRAHWLAQCILFSCEDVGLAHNNRPTKPKKNESAAEKQLRKLAAKALQIFAEQGA